ncbi:adenosine deaminase [Paenibacillus sp. NPDC058071]|uniref:adenosine deaminase n=1 Tax=Paenibacillus sp. NPDC058071 TaxID=3346326 RepID=UPI0036DDD068
MDEQIWAKLKRLPKVDLHVHLDGSVLPETVRELARQQGKQLPLDVGGGLTPWMQIGESCGSLREYLSKFDFVLPFLQIGEALKRTAYEVVQQAAEQRCLHVEVRFAPMLHTREGLSPTEAVRCVTEGLALGERRFGISARAIIISMRSDSFERNMQALEAAYAYFGRGVVAVDLAGDEAAFPPERHRPLFEAARRYGMPVTIHAGEAAGAAHVREAIEGLGASRIGHGVRIAGDDEVIELVRKSGTPLELCPISNIQTKAVNGWDTYPLKAFLDEGIVVTANTDNMTVSGTNMTLEYAMLMQHCGLTMEDIAVLIANGAEAAFLEGAEKQMLLQQIHHGLKAEGLSPGSA